MWLLIYMQRNESGHHHHGNNFKLKEGRCLVRLGMWGCFVMTWIRVACEANVLTKLHPSYIDQCKVPYAIAAEHTSQQLQQ
jgi:hypothetical protein